MVRPTALNMSGTLDCTHMQMIVLVFLSLPFRCFLRHSDYGIVAQAHCFGGIMRSEGQDSRPGASCCGWCRPCASLILAASDGTSQLWSELSGMAVTVPSAFTLPSMQRESPRFATRSLLPPCNRAVTPVVPDKDVSMLVFAQSC